jgi:CheY-like chemotaxis protein
MIKVIIVDDHPVVRRGLRQIIEDEPDMEVVGEAKNAEYTGYTEGELLNTNFYNLLTEESQRLMGERLEKLYAGVKIPQIVECCIRTICNKAIITSETSL